MSTTTILYSFNNNIANIKFKELLTSGGQIEKVSISDGLLEDINYSLSDLKAEYQANGYSDVITDLLKNIYLLLGSSEQFIINSSIGDSQRYQELELITNYYSVSVIDSGIPTKEGFFDIYSKINSGDVEEISLKFSKENGYDYIDAKETIVGTLKYLRPLVKNLKDDENSLLVVMHDYNFPELMPVEADEIIDGEIKKLIDIYKDNIDFVKLLKSE